MSTRCIIAKKMQGGKYKAVYSHWDGYPEKPGAGWTLRNNYTTTQSVNKLLSKGDISSLRGKIGRKHDFDDYQTAKINDWSTFYYRDRGESWSETKPKMFSSLKNLIDYASGSWAEYLYIFENGEWHYIDLEQPGTMMSAGGASPTPGWQTNYWGV